MALHTCLSVITFNVKGLSASVKRHRVVEWIRKHFLHICCLQETHLRTKDLHRVKVKGWKKIYSKQTDMKKKKPVSIWRDVYSHYLSGKNKLKNILHSPEFQILESHLISKPSENMAKWESKCMAVGGIKVG